MKRPWLAVTAFLGGAALMVTLIVRMEHLEVRLEHLDDVLHGTEAVSGVQLRRTYTGECEMTFDHFVWRSGPALPFWLDQMTGAVFTTGSGYGAASTRMPIGDVP